ncbi:MAG: 2-oxo acid dehydrogenase subunit E2 [Pirellulales bacterium]
MDVEMKMPDLSNSADEVTVIEWLVALGQPVKRGERLLEVETDKATMEVESIATGILKSQNARPGDVIAAGRVIAIIEAQPGATGASVSRPDAHYVPSPQEPAASQGRFPSGSADQPASPSRAVGGMFARNRRAADRSTNAESSVPMNVVQRTVARRMLESKQTVPHFYLQTSASAEPMRARRKQTNSERIVWEAFFVVAVGRALRNFNRMCFRFDNGRLVRQETDGVGVAIDIDGDLYVVPIADPASKTVEQTSSEIRGAADRLRAGDAALKHVQPANITITNLGMANVESFIPIVNPPESCILGIGKIAPQAAVMDGQPGIQHRVSLTLSVDHRVANGRYAADFLGNIVEELVAF